MPKSVLKQRFPLIWRFGPGPSEATLYMVDTIKFISRFAKRKGWRFKSDRSKYGGHWIDKRTGDTYYIEERGAQKYLRGPHTFRRGSMDNEKIARELVRLAKTILSGMKVTKPKDIPSVKQEVRQGWVTYRGLGLGKLSRDFYDLTGEDGVRINVRGKEYYITDSDFQSLGGIKKMKFKAPHRGR